MEENYIRYKKKFYVLIQKKKLNVVPDMENPCLPYPPSEFVGVVIKITLVCQIEHPFVSCQQRIKLKRDTRKFQHFTCMVRQNWKCYTILSRVTEI